MRTWIGMAATAAVLAATGAAGQVVADRAARGAQGLADAYIVNDPVVAAPKSQAFSPWLSVPAHAAEPHIASGSGRGWHQVIFPVRKDSAADDAPDQRLQHAIAVDFTPASARINAYIEGQDGSVRNPSGDWERIWAPAQIHGYGVNGRLYWCYSFAMHWGYRASDGGTVRNWRLLFYPYNLEDGEDFSYRFAAEQTESVTCERDPENDGGVLGTGTGGDFGPFNVHVDGPQGSQAQIAIGIRDHACEDGDVVSVYIGDGYNDRAVFTNREIFNDWDEKLVGVRAGYYYQVRAVAINGTGFKGNCNYGDVNTGEMRVRSSYSSEISTWRAPGGSESAGIINVIAR